jgi:hypothetical protein
MKTATKMVLVCISVFSIFLSILSLSTLVCINIPNAVKEIGTGDKYIADWLSSIHTILIVILSMNAVSFLLFIVLLISYLKSKN